MSYKRVIIPAICVFLAVTIVVLGCGNLGQEHILKGYFHLEQKQYDRAIADCNKAIELDPELAAAYSNRGAAYRSKGEYDKAIADYDKAIELDPELTAAYYNRGLAYYHKGEYDKAASDFEKVVQIATDPGLVEAARQALKSIGK